MSLSFMFEENRGGASCIHPESHFQCKLSVSRSFRVSGGNRKVPSAKSSVECSYFLKNYPPYLHYALATQPLDRIVQLNRKVINSVLENLSPFLK